MEIPEPVRRLARQPLLALPTPRNVKRFELPGAVLFVNPSFPNVNALSPDESMDVDTAVAATRAIAREHGKEIVAWWLLPDQARAYGAAFEAHGILNEDTPGLEAEGSALALVEPPVGEPVDGVEVTVVEAYEDFVAAWGVVCQCFGLPLFPDAQLRTLFGEYVAEDLGRTFVARVDGHVVGTGYAAFAEAGLNLTGGSVVPEARGRGVYRALLAARWDFAVARGTPALTVQAGRMSRPVCERLGFQFVDRALIYVDKLAD